MVSGGFPSRARVGRRLVAKRGKKVVLSDSFPFFLFRRTLASGFRNWRWSIRAKTLRLCIVPLARVLPFFFLSFFSLPSRVARAERPSGGANLLMSLSEASDLLFVPGNLACETTAAQMIGRRCCRSAQIPFALRGLPVERREGSFRTLGSEGSFGARLRYGRVMALG